MSALQVIEHGRRPRMVRLTFDPPVVCPAGSPVFESEQGSGCRCKIEGKTMTAHEDPSTLMVFCTNRYDLCTTWQTEKDWIEEGYRTEVADDERDTDAARKARESLMEQREALELEVTHFEMPE